MPRAFLRFRACQICNIAKSPSLNSIATTATRLNLHSLHNHYHQMQVLQVVSHTNSHPKHTRLIMQTTTTHLQGQIGIRQLNRRICRRQILPPTITPHQLQYINLRRAPPLSFIQPKVIRLITGTDQLPFLLPPIALVVTPRP